MIAFICILLILPTLAVAAHDIYIAYGRAEEDAVAALGLIEWSDVGWLWVKYAPESYDWAHKTINPALWDSLVLPVLEQTAALVCLAPALAVYIYLLLARQFGLWPFGDVVKHEKSKYAFDRVDQPKGRMKYKRK